MIEWNKVTWYSKLLSAIFLLGVVPVLTFYIGTQYEAVRNNSNPPFSATSDSINKTTVASSVRSVSWGDYLADNIPVSISDATTTYREACGGPVDLGSSDNSDVQYGDLLGDGGEEALIATHSCLAGTEGYDIFGVFRIKKDGTIEELKFNDNDGTPDYLGTSQFLGKQYPSISDYAGKKAIVINGQEYLPGDPNSRGSGRVYQKNYVWDGERFLDTKDVFKSNTSASTAKSVLASPECASPRPGTPVYLQKEFSKEADIYPGMHVKVTLSCDQRQLTFSGAVNQIIKISDNPDEYDQYDMNDAAGFADVTSGEGNLEFEDYNFDGYKDFSAISSYGSQDQTYVFFLFDPVKKEFIYNKEMSALHNLSLAPAPNADKRLVQTFCTPYPNCKRVEWKWEKGNLVKIIPESQDSPSIRIDSISPASGPLGTNVLLKGNFTENNFGGPEWSTGVVLERDGQKIASIDLMPSNDTAGFTMSPEICTSGGGAMGGPCTSSVTLSPGIYDIYYENSALNMISNKVQFTVTQ